MINNAEKSKCQCCEKEYEIDDLRPYGKNGTLICYECGMKNIEETNIQIKKAYQNCEEKYGFPFLTEKGIGIPLKNIEIIQISSTKEQGICIQKVSFADTEENKIIIKNIVKQTAN